MIQKQSPLNFQPFNEIFTTPQIVEQILKAKYYASLVDYRYQLAFQRNFGKYIQHLSHFKYRSPPSDSLTFSNEQEMLNKYLSFQQITFRIKQAILSRVTKDSIAPLLRNRGFQANVINRSDKLNRNELIGIRDSNTMHTDSSQTRNRGQQTKIYKILQSKIAGSTTSESNRTKQQSSQMLRKVTKDLSKMIKGACTSGQKKKRINLKFARNFMAQKNLSKSKRKTLEFTVSRPKAQNFNTMNGYGLQNAKFEEPEENYGLKKFKLSKNKNSKQDLHFNLKNKSKQIALHFRGTEQKKLSKDLSLCRKRDTQKSFMSPLTPKPISISKSRQGWDETSNKLSKYSLKARVSSHKKFNQQKKDRYLQVSELKNSKTSSKFPTRLILK